MIRLLKLLRWPLLFSSLLLTGAGAVLAMHPTWIRVESVQIDLMPGSQEYLLYQRIQKTLGAQLASLQGRYFWQVPLSSVFNLASQDQRVKRVMVHREFPSRIKVEIEPYTPILDYLSADGRVYPVATDATLLPAHGLSDSANLPLLRGEELKNSVELREAAVQLYKEIPEEGSLSKKNISEIYYSKKNGFSVFISGQGSELKMGDTDFGPKVSRVQKVLSYLDSQGVKGRVIDARFSKKVVVRVRKAP